MYGFNKCVLSPVFDRVVADNGPPHLLGHENCHGPLYKFIEDRRRGISQPNIRFSIHPLHSIRPIVMKLLIHLRLIAFILDAVSAASQISFPESFFDYIVPSERSNFLQLIESNPNYFGNYPTTGQNAVHPLADDTTYEQLISVGFSSTWDLLEATIEVKLPFGFSGQLCSDGSWEYVRFWVDYGSGWNDLGYAAVNTHDIPNIEDCAHAPEKPLFYTLSIPFNPPGNFCSNPILPNIRATLSWNQIPDTSPDWNPVWGNTINQHIQSPTASPITPRGLALMPLEHSVVPSSECTQVNETIRGMQNETVNIAYEELISLGLDYNSQRLTATIRVKLPSGYGTDLCHNGSLEYISFWADWDNTCQWTFLGTLTINVHNIPSISPDGLTYTAVLPVNISSVRNLCGVLKVSRVRAALSWNSPPPAPPNLPSWGNFLEAHVQLLPYSILPNFTRPEIDSIGKVPVAFIDYTGTGMTMMDKNGNPPRFRDDASFTDPWLHTRQSPFGGLIIVQGLPRVGRAYRLLARPASQPLSSGAPVTNPIAVFDVTDLNNPIKVIPPNSDSSQGWFNYLDIPYNADQILSYWAPPPSADGLWEIQLQMATLGPAYTLLGSTDWYRILVNNVPPTGDIVLNSGPQCQFILPTVITGTFSAYDQFFGAYTLSEIPSFIYNHVVPSIGYSPVSSGTLSLTANANEKPCGYIVLLEVWGITVYDSSSAGYRRFDKPAGFCLRAPFFQGLW